MSVSSEKADEVIAMMRATLHEAIASAYGNRHPNSRQYERDEMAAACINRAVSRMTDRDETAVRRFREGPS